MVNITLPQLSNLENIQLVIDSYERIHHGTVPPRRSGKYIPSLLFQWKLHKRNATSKLKIDSGDFNLTKERISICSKQIHMWYCTMHGGNNAWWGPAVKCYCQSHHRGPHRVTGRAVVSVPNTTSYASKIKMVDKQNTSNVYHVFCEERKVV